MHDCSVDIRMEQHYGLHHEDDFGPTQLDGLVSDHSPHQSPPHEYGGFHFPSYAQLEPMYSGPIEPSYSSPPPPHPLISLPQWPSQITNPSEESPSSMAPAPRPILPVSSKSTPAPVLAPAPAPAPTITPTPAPSKPLPVSSSNRRIMLTDGDRRRMCDYHNENPTVKQTEIGAMFGVERSTVSKVLRNKEKYLVPDEGSKSPAKRSKSKFPDIERTLSQWAKNRLSQRLPLDDNAIRDQARIFATTVGNPECHKQVNDPTWLKHFKHKNCLPASPLDETKGELDSFPLGSRSGSQTPNGASPVAWDGVPISPQKDEVKAQIPEHYVDSGNYAHAHSQSTVSLGSCFSDITIESSFTNDLRSPTSPFFSPMSSCGPSPSMPAQKMARLPTLTAASSLRRRQTVPLTGPDSSPDWASSKPRPQSVISESPVDEMDVSPLSVSDQTLHYSRTSTTSATPASNPSPLSMAPPSTISPSIGTNVSPSIGSASSLPSPSPSSPPSQDEARAALSTLMKFIKHQPNGAVDPYDYLTMAKWMKLLEIEEKGLPGGMHSIPMSERADGTVPVGRKRSEHSLS